MVMSSSIDLKKNKNMALFFVIVLWVVYVLSVVGLRQLERIDIMGADKCIIAGAVSYAYYHVPFGKGVPEVSGILQENTVANAINKIREQGIKHKDVKTFGNDGSGSFAVLMMYNLGMKLFGVNIYAIFLFYSLFILLSHLAFSFRFHDARFIFSPIILFSLTLMLFTPLVTNTGIAGQIAVGMTRYFTVLGMLPAIHLLLELLDSKKTLNRSMLICLIIQTTIIGLCGFAQKSSAYLFVSLFLFGSIYFLFVRKNLEMKKIFLNKLKNILLTVVIFSVCFYAIVPKSYIKNHQLTDDFWHRIWVGLGSSPEWPFKNINEELYSGCLQKGTADPNGACAYERYAKKHNLDPKGPNYMMNIMTYERAARDSFFEVVLNYPIETLKTFFYYKPINVITNLRYDLHYSELMRSGSDFIYLMLSLFILTLSWFFYFSKETLSKLTLSMLGLIGLLIFSVNTMYIVAWANPFVIIELVLVFHIFIIFSLMISTNFIKNFLYKSFNLLASKT